MAEVIFNVFGGIDFGNWSDQSMFIESRIFALAYAAYDDVVNDWGEIFTVLFQEPCRDPVYSSRFLGL